MALTLWNDEAYQAMRARAETAEAALPELRQEVSFWRREAMARLWMAVALHRGLEKKGDHRRAADLRVSTIGSTLAALRDAAAKAWHPDCETCAKPLPYDSPYQIITVDEDGTTARIHAACGDPDQHTYEADRSDDEKVIRQAREIMGHKIGAAIQDARGVAAMAPAVAAAPPPPVDRTQQTLVDGSPVTTDHRELKPNGQQKDYVVLSAEERAKGFVRPVRTAYVHQKCGTLTTMSRALAETYARDPAFYSGTFCCGCGAHFPVGESGEFIWDDGSRAKVGT